MKQLLLACALALCILSPAVGENAQSENATSGQDGAHRLVDQRSQNAAARNREWEELTAQIGKGVTGGRFKAEALDTQALILTGDKDPLDIVLRRTHAADSSIYGASPAEGGT